MQKSPEFSLWHLQEGLGKTPARSPGQLQWMGVAKTDPHGLTQQEAVSYVPNSKQWLVMVGLGLLLHFKRYCKAGGALSMHGASVPPSPRYATPPILTGAMVWHLEVTASQLHALPIHFWSSYFQPFGASERWRTHPLSNMVWASACWGLRWHARQPPWLSTWGRGLPAPLLHTLLLPEL